MNKTLGPVAEITHCSIPQEKFDQGPSKESHFVLPCRHVFGSKCIIRWLDEADTRSCPACRRDPFESVKGKVPAEIQDPRLPLLISNRYKPYDEVDWFYLADCKQHIVSGFDGLFLCFWITMSWLEWSLTQFPRQC